MSAESDSPSAEHEPTRALLLAQALDACIQAERAVPGSADHLIAQQPAWARTELRQLVALASSLNTAASSAVMSEEFRAAARARLMWRISGQTEHQVPLPLIGAQNGHAPVPGAWLSTVGPPGATASRNGHRPVRRRRRRGWLWRGSAGGLLAAVLVMGATLTASASALPGEPLYGVKQAREEIGFRLAPNDQSRTLVLMGQADARLDETARLLRQGRTQYVAETTQRFDDTLTRAATTYVVTIAEAPPAEPPAPTIEDRLNQQQEELQTMLATAPEPAQADLRGALVATQRSRALVADPKPNGPAANTRPAPVAPVAAADTATPTAEPSRTAVLRVVAPPPVDLMPQRRAEPTPVVALEQHDAQEVSVEHNLSGPAGAVTRGAASSSVPGRSSRGRQVSSPSLQDVQAPMADVADAAPEGDSNADRGREDQGGGQPQATRVVVVPRSNPPSANAPATVANDRPAVSQSQGQSQSDAHGAADQPNPTTFVARQAPSSSSSSSSNQDRRSSSDDSHSGPQPTSVSTRSFSGDGNTSSRPPSPTPTPSTSNTLRAQSTPAPTTLDSRRSSADGSNFTNRTGSQTTSDRGPNSTNDDTGGHGH